MEIVNQQQYYDQPQQQQQQPMYLPQDIPQSLPGQDPEFMRWLFDLKERVVTPLKYAWMGYELDVYGKWVKKNNCKPIMNMQGINWCTEMIESYINPAYIISNYNGTWFNYTMRQVTGVIINNLTARHRDFELNKLDIENVTMQIESKIQAILLGARGDGYRNFFGKTRQEHLIVNKNESARGRNSMFGLFNKRDLNATEARVGY